MSKNDLFMLKRKKNGHYLAVLKNFGKSVFVHGSSKRAAIFRGNIFNCIYIDKNHYEGKLLYDLCNFTESDSFIYEGYMLEDYEGLVDKASIFDSLEEYTEYVRDKIMSDYDVVRLIPQKKQSSLFNLSILQK